MKIINRGNPLLQRLAEAEGYCCVYAYVSSWGEESNVVLERRLGISRQAIVKWKDKLRAGDIKCGYRKTGLGTCRNGPIDALGFDETDDL